MRVIPGPYDEPTEEDIEWVDQNEDLIEDNS